MAGDNTLVFCGLTTLDISQRVQTVPKSNEKVVSQNTSVDVGGPAANAARTASAIGLPCTLVTLLGTSPLAQIAREYLPGISVVDLAEDSHFPVSTVLIDDDGHRAVASQNNPSRQSRLADLAVLDDAAVLLVDGHMLDLQIHLAKEANKRGIPVVLDGGSYKPGIAELLEYVTHAIFSADYVDPQGREVFSLGSPDPIAFIAQTHGQEPVVIHERGAGSPTAFQTTVPVPQVEVVDSLGAGDVLHGAFAAGLAKDMSSREALEFAVGIASKSVQFPGAMGWTKEETSTLTA